MQVDASRGAILLLVACGSGAGGDSATPTIGRGGPTTGSTTGSPTTEPMEWPCDCWGPVTDCVFGPVWRIHPGNAVCGTQQLGLCLIDPLGVEDWTFGIVDVDAGWTGEDCFSDEALCHPFQAPALALDAGCEPDEVVAGQSTRHRESGDSTQTYVVTDEGGECLVWGADTSWYASLGCTQMM